MKVYREVKILLITILIAVSQLSCTVFNNTTSKETITGFTYVAPRGNPKALSIIWSPKAPDRLLVNTLEPTRAEMGVYILDVATKEKTVLIGPGSSGVMGTAWMPDGERVILLVDGATDKFNQAGHWAFNPIDNTSELITSKMDGFDWLSDGNNSAEIRFEYMSTNNPRQVSISLIDTRTNESKVIYSKQGAIFTGSSASPDGKYLVFSLNLDYYSTDSDLYLLEVETGNAIQMTHDAVSSNPQWSPVGDLFLYVKSRRVSGETLTTLHIMRPDGSCDVEVSGVDVVMSPTWSPDGKRIAFIGEDGIYIMDTTIVFGRDIYEELCP
jgi:Tol biopolymer transport system component